MPIKPIATVVSKAAVAKSFKERATVEASPTERGGALLSVLWLSAALAAISLGLATTVRTEVERVHTQTDQLKAYYLASGAVERALLYAQWGRQTPLNPDGSSPFWAPTMPVLRFRFPEGFAEVEMRPESAKFNVNRANQEELLRLLIALGQPAEAALQTTAAIIDWRTPAPPMSLTPFDQIYLQRTPSFRARHASFEEIEELLMVHGVTPDLFYGTWVRNAEGRLERRPGLQDCLSVYSQQAAFDVNTVAPPVLAAAGFPPNAISYIVSRREAMPFRNPQELRPIVDLAGPAGARLRIGGNSIYLIRATATVRGANGLPGDVRRTVAAQVKFNFDEKNEMSPYHLLRWYDNAGNN